jgi:hypothetical protein
MNTPLSLSFPRYGDKLNSAFFEDYLGELMAERDRAGLTGLIRQIDALMITVEPGHSLAYVAELCLMTPYHYLVTLESETHFSHVLRIDMDSPDILVREVKDDAARGIFRSLNEVYPVGAQKPNSRYMGEVFRVENLHAVVELQKVPRHPLLQSGSGAQVGAAGQHGHRQAEPLHAQHRRLLGAARVRHPRLRPRPVKHSRRPPGRLRVGQGEPRPARPGPCCCPSTTWRRASTARTARRRSSNT